MNDAQLTLLVKQVRRLSTLITDMASYLKSDLLSLPSTEFESTLSELHLDWIRFSVMSDMVYQTPSRTVFVTDDEGVKCVACGYVRTVWKVCPSGCDTSDLIDARSASPAAAARLG